MRKLILSVAVLCLAAAGLIIGAQLNSTDASAAVTPLTSVAAAPAATFAGTNTGAIPDGLSGTPPQFGASRVINFAVSGIAGAITNIDVNMTLTHSWAGDIDVVLAAPGGSPSFVVVSRIGVTTAGSFGSSSDYSGTYVFDDSAAGTNIWTAAAATPIPVGTYRTTGPGQTGQTNPAPVTSMLPAFSGLTPAQINGTWTLTFRDAASADTGSVTAANLIIDAGAAAPAQHVVDFDGDGKTDYAVVRNTGGGPGGQITWFINNNATGATTAAAWGISGDFFTPIDFDGDNKTDIAIYRPGAPTVAAFYILQSSTATVRIDTFGQSGDDPSVVDDYDGDGKADVAVYRAGANSGDPSTWYYRGSLTPGVINYVPWGKNGDFPGPGDYDGDGKADFVVQRNNGGGTAAFWRDLTTAPNDVVVFGTPTDVIVPGDYDGDGKTDIAVVRGSAGNYNWWVLPSSTGVGSQTPYAIFGASATDFFAQGDYDGDGKTDVAIWRPSATPGASAFWANGSTSGVIGRPFGQNGDFPVANYNRH